MHIVLFDIDGTLLSTGGAGHEAFKLAMADLFGIAELGEVPFSGRTDRAIAADLFAMHGVDNTPENWQRFVGSYLEYLSQVLPNCQGCVLPGVEGLLEELDRRDDVAMGLLTGNVREGARLKLAHYQLADYFPFGGFGDQSSERTDVAAEALAAALQHLSCEMDGNTVYVIGDTPADVRCGRAIGAKVVAVATGLPDAEALAAAKPDVLLDDLADPSALLDLMT